LLRFREILNGVERAVNLMIRQFVRLQLAGEECIISGKINDPVTAPN